MRVTVLRHCLGKEVNAARVCHNIIEITEMGEVGRAGDQSGMKIAELPLWNGILPPVKEIPMRHELGQFRFTKPNARKEPDTKIEKAAAAVFS